MDDVNFPIQCLSLVYSKFGVPCILRTPACTELGSRKNLGPFSGSQVKYIGVDIKTSRAKVNPRSKAPSATPEQKRGSQTAVVDLENLPETYKQHSASEVFLGLEEEFFAIELGHTVPTLQSMDYLRRIWWTNPRQYLASTASNFAKGKDRKKCFMGSIEISTGKHESPKALIADLIERRTTFAAAARTALIVPIGSLAGHECPSNTASSHIHVGVSPDSRDRVYSNLAYFLPLLAIASACSPTMHPQPTCLSNRLAYASLLGGLKEDREYRFQDIILSKRLGTIEMRVFDPIPELDRLEVILTLVQEIAKYPGTFEFNREEYNSNRQNWAVNGLDAGLEKKLTELREIVDVDRHWIDKPLGPRLQETYSNSSIAEMYAELDSIWRAPTGIRSSPKGYSQLAALKGIAGYYVPRMPFILYKGYLEWYGKLPK